MPSDIHTAKNFLVNSDYPLDKIIYMTTGQVTIPSTDFTDVVISHGLPFTPLMDGTYSLTTTFDTAFDIGSGQPGTDPFAFFAIDTSIYADSTNVNMHITNYTAGSVTVYYRIFGLMPSNVSAEAPHTSSIADDFVVNTDYNYTKLYIATRVTSSSTLTHGLGYRPQVSSWYELIGVGIYKTIYADINNSFTPTLVKVGTNDITVTINNASYAVHIRGYLDE